MSPYPNTPESTHHLISEASRPEIGMSAEGDIAGDPPGTGLETTWKHKLLFFFFQGTAFFQTPVLLRSDA